MREAIRDIDRLRHIDECIEHINDFLNGKSFDDMKSNIMCYHAVVYPWRDIVDMRNALVHGYITTNASLVWDTYTNDLPSFKKQVTQYIEELNNIVEP